MKCPVCGKYEFIERGDYDICPQCHWENDSVQANDHNYAGGANALSVNEARIEYFALSGAYREAALSCLNEYRNQRQTIRERYQGINRAASPEKAAEETKEYKKAREEYINHLNRIMQPIQNQTESREQKNEL